jgi:glycosyltransferase involved in cell wall biosynthesis
MDTSRYQHQHDPLISVVIPALNEAPNLPFVLPSLPAIISEVILVDGHSIDDTVAVAQRLCPTIRILRQTGQGKGNALRDGFAACTGDIIVMLDADGSADPGEIPQFVEALLAGYDFAKGSRFLKGGHSKDITLLRRLGNLLLSKLTNLLFRTQFSDLCYGYNAFWTHCLADVAVDSDGFEIETLITLRMHKAGLTIVEVPSCEHRRMFGTSKLRTFRDGWRVFKTIVKERRHTSSPLSQQPRLTASLNVTSQPSTPEEIVLESSSHQSFLYE